MMDGWIMDGWINGWMMDGWIDGWMMDGWIDEWINSMGSIHRVEYYRTIKRREDLTQATTGMDPEHTLLSGRGRHRRTQCVTPLIGNVQNRQVHRDSKRVCGCQGLRQAGEK